MKPFCRLAIFVVAAVAHAMTATVELKRVPEGGIQPQVTAGPDGAIHLVYFNGDPAAGDLYYSRSSDGGTSFSRAIRVNSEPGTAIAIGNIRGARIALGRYGRAYVSWNGSSVAAKLNGGRAPMLYTRLNESGKAFEPERNLVHSAYGVDGGGGVAADRSGNVYVFWHARIPGSAAGEANRRVWVTKSSDDGRVFEPEKVAWDEPTGACACCSLNAYADDRGKVYVLFRSAKEVLHRDMYLLVSSDHGSTFDGADISKWDVGYCVMSAEAFAKGKSGLIAAWETEKQIHFGRVDPATLKVADETPAGPPGLNRKYPALAENANGSTLVAWTEGMGWKKGGSLEWEIVDRNGKAIDSLGHADGVPVWSLPAAYARRDGNFTILY